MLHIISSDVPATPAGQRRRAKLARLLEGLGVRVQYSVFELEIDPVKVPAILRSIQDLLNLDEDSLRIYICCASCARLAARVGPEAPCEYGHDLLLY